jgi:hypothetical protein
MKRIESFTTTYNTKIDTTVLSEVIRRIKSQDDPQNIIVEELREALSVHDNDIDEAYEIYDYCQDLVDEENLETEIKRFNKLN